VPKKSSTDKKKRSSYKRRKEHLPMRHNCCGEDESNGTGGAESDGQSDEHILFDLVKTAVSDLSEQRVKIFVDSHGAENKLANATDLNSPTAQSKLRSLSEVKTLSQSFYDSADNIRTLVRSYLNDMNYTIAFD